MSLLKIVSLGKILFILLLLFLLQNISLFASTIKYDYYFTEPQITKQGDYHRIEMNDCMSITKPGEPELPSKSVQLLLPPGEQAVSISVIYKGINDLPGEYRIYPRQKPYPISYKGEVEFTEPDPEIYDSDNPFPEKLHTEIQTQYLKGHSIAILNIFPVQYIPSSGKISYYSEMEVVIETEPTTEAENAFNNFYKADEITKARVKNIVHNLEQIESYPANSNTRAGDNKYVIVTGNSYSSYFASFAEFKTKQGYNVLIKTTNDIYSEYSGVDNQEKIRNFIKYAYQNLGTEYVLLGGDVEIVPHRGFYGSVNSTSGLIEDYDIPADLYYAALDRVGSGTGPDWNVDNDNKWGENSEADYFAEICVGRISADIGSEFTAALNKQMMYQQSPVGSDLEKAIMVGEQLNSNPLIWGGTYKDEVMNGGNYNGYYTTGFPGNFTIQTQYERNGSWSYSDLKEKMNDGTNIINHLGHSNVDNNMKFYRNHVTNSNLTSNGINHNFYIIYTQGCYPASFDNRRTNGSYDPEDCIGEKFTTISNGCVAFIGNSRYGWFTTGGTNGSSQYLDRQFFDALFGENIHKLGEMNNDSKEDGASQCNSWDALRWSYYATNLFGDPSLDVWTNTPGTLTPSYANSINITDTQLSVYVGISGALVGLSQDGSHIGSGITDGTGNVTVIFDNPTSSGTLDIYISAHNYSIYTGTINVGGGGGDYTIAGNIGYLNNNNPVPNTNINLSGAGAYSEITDGNGDYTFNNIVGGNYILTPNKYDDLGGLGGTDASRIARYTVGLYSFNYDEMIAADVTMDGTISGTDASRVARYSVNLINYLNDYYTDWVFVSEWIDPWNWTPIIYNSTREYSPLNSDMYNQNFTGIRLGDVTGNWTPGSLKNETPGSITSMYVDDESPLQLPIVINNSNQIEGIDIIMEYDQKVLHPINVTLNNTLENYNYAIESLFKGGTGNIIIYAQEQAENYSNVVATVNFEVIGSSNEQVDLLISTLDVNESQSNGGFVVNNGETITRALKINQDQQYNSQELICSISPNPCTSHTTINYSITNDSQVKVLLYNTRGQLIETLNDNFENAGENHLTLKTDKLKNGIYFCRIIADNQTKNVKLLIMK